MFGCIDSNSNASASDPTSPRYLEGNQSETSMVAVARNDFPESPRRLIVAYNDSYNVFADPATGPDRRPNSSLMGLAVSDDPSSSPTLGAHRSV